MPMKQEGSRSNNATSNRPSKWSNATHNNNRGCRRGSRRRARIRRLSRRRKGLNSPFAKRRRRGTFRSAGFQPAFCRGGLHGRPLLCLLAQERAPESFRNAPGARYVGFACGGFDFSSLLFHLWSVPHHSSLVTASANSILNTFYSGLPSGCERRVPLLKLHVCWDAAVCAVSAGGFFSVWDGARKTDVRDGVSKASGWRPVFSA